MNARTRHFQRKVVQVLLVTPRSNEVTQSPDEAPLGMSHRPDWHSAFAVQSWKLAVLAVQVPARQIRSSVQGSSTQL